MNEKGVTLIELIGIIVVLALIFLIAVPQVTKIVNIQKEKAFKVNVDGIIKAIKTDIATYERSAVLLKYKYENSKLSLVDSNDDSLIHPIKTNGVLSGEGVIYVDRSLDMKYVIYDVKYCAIKDFSSEITYTLKTDVLCELPIGP